MPISFLPKIVCSELTEVTPEVLKSRDIRLLMLDFDNTIVPYRTDVPTDAMARWIAEIRATDIAVCIVSNTKKHRVLDFSAKYGLDCILRAKKPFGKGIRQCLDRYGIPAEHAALVGDQIFTDTLGANLCGVTPILVNAIHNHNIFMKARHVAELPFRIAARSRRL